MLKRLLAGFFSSGDKGASSHQHTAPAETLEYKGFEVVPEPQSANGQYRVSGRIRKPGDDGVMREQRFERSDTVPDREGCIELTRLKAQRYIDDHGDRLFEPR